MAHSLDDAIGDRLTGNFGVVALVKKKKKKLTSRVRMMRRWKDTPYKDTSLILHEHCMYTLKKQQPCIARYAVCSEQTV